MVGLRDLKKQQTRERIVETAGRLFSERGFDKVTVADVAREAQVALATVFNYFPGKEDLFYSPLEAFGARLIEAVRTRAAGEPVLIAFRRHLSSTDGLLGRIQEGDTGALERLRAVNQVIAGSATLQGRERLALARVADQLAALLADEADEADEAAGAAAAGTANGAAGAHGDDVQAAVAANALMGVHRVLVDHVRRRILADDDLGDLATEVEQLRARGFALLEQGLGGYAPGPS
jgi:AcrR family transcriptional regulator